MRILACGPTAMVVAARENQGWPGWRKFLLILAAMVCARTCAMTFNRIADRVAQLIDFQMFSILLLDPSGKKLQHRFSVRFNESVQIKSDVSIDAGLVGNWFYLATGGDIKASRELRSLIELPAAPQNHPDANSFR